MDPLEVLHTDRRDDWLDVVRRAPGYDFYHLPFYSALAEARGEGTAELLVYRAGDDFVALPLLLRPLGELPCREPPTAALLDATSVYGYAGPLASRADLPAAVVGGFQAALTSYLEREHVVSLFSRLHPLLDQTPLLRGLGECVDGGETVSIDLTLPLDVQRTAFRKSYKRSINKLGREGMTWRAGADPADCEAFYRIYTETMERVGAHERYHFERAYFEAFFATDELVTRMLLCEDDGTVAAGGMITLCGDVAQAHLSATADAFLHRSPSRLMVDGARRWAHARGARVLHLGGGFGGQEDSLFLFKSGFSKRRHRFRMWRWIRDPDAVAALVAERDHYAAKHDVQKGGPGFFPPYRCPVCRCTWKEERA